MDMEHTLIAMLSYLQTVSGSWHWPSIIMLAGWLVAGAAVFANLALSRHERERAGPWTLSEGQKKTISAALADSPKGRVAFEYTAADQVRSHGFATTLKQLFQEAGYDGAGYMPAFQETGNAAPLVGIRITTKEQSDHIGNAIQQAFKKIGIDAIRSQ